jgi:hypothetical protein
MKNSKLLTLNKFFWYSTKWEGDNSNNCGFFNQMRSAGWISPIDYDYSLIIEKMPKESFTGYIINVHTNKIIYLQHNGGITSIITEANKVIETF